jgi:hypothetical protein
MDGFKPSEPDQDSAATTSSLISPELAATAEKSSHTPELEVALNSLTLTQDRNSIKPGENGSQPAGTATTKLLLCSGVASG